MFDAAKMSQINNNSLPNGKYQTINGSTVKVFGEYGGKVKVNFDWLEEKNACCDCRVEAYPEQFDEKDWRLVWNCDECGGGNAKLFSELSTKEYNY